MYVGDIRAGHGVGARVCSVSGGEDDGGSRDAACGAGVGTGREGGGHVTENILLGFEPGVERFEDGRDLNGCRRGRSGR